MAKLSISDNQNTLVLSPVTTHMEDALAEGVSAPSNNNAVPLTERYTTIKASEKTQIKNAYKVIIASVLKVLNIDKPLPATKFNGTFTATSGVPGTFTVVDGIITTFTPT